MTCVGLVATGSAEYGPATLLAAYLAALRHHGAAEQVRFAATRDDAQRAVDELAAAGVDGLIVSLPATSANALRIPAGLPTLTMTDVPNPQLLVISLDQRAGGRLATQHLLDLGHRCVHHISGPADSQHTPQRTNGWRDALVAARVTAPGPALGGDWTAAAGHAAMTELLRFRPPVTAVFAANDQMAVGAMRAVADAGLRVPHDISVVGFDDLPEAAYVSPSLTSVQQDLTGAALTAVGALVAMINGDKTMERRRFLPVGLSVRESSGPPHPGRLGSV